MSRKNYVSIDIGTKYTKIIMGRFDKGVLYLEKAFSTITPQGSWQDGRLPQQEQLKLHIAEALQQHQIKSKDTVFCLHSSLLIKRDLELPKVKAQEMNSLIRYEIEQYLPIDLNEYIIEYKVLEERKDNARIEIAALPKAIAADYLELAKQLNLEPRVLDIQSNAVSKLFCLKQQVNGGDYDLDKTAAFVDLGCSSINISIVSKGVFQFSRLIPLSENELTAAVAAALNIDLQQAEEKKLVYGSMLGSAADSDIRLMNASIREVVVRWVDDIMRVLQYYKTRNANNTIDEMYLYGGTSNLKGLEEYMADNAGIPVSKLKSLGVVQTSKQLPVQDIENYINAMGAIIQR